MGDADKNNETILAGCLVKLLDKAGHDPRLTPRILREKAEDRLSMPRHSLKPKREWIKKIIVRWWTQNVDSKIEKDKVSNGVNSTRVEVSEEEKAMKQYSKLAKAIGHSELLKDLGNLSHDAKISTLRSKFIADGYSFSNVPTDDEIATALRQFELKKELKNIEANDNNASKKRPAENNSSVIKSEKPKIAKHTLRDSDEEADF